MNHLLTFILALKMFKPVFWFSIAAVCNGAAWWAHILGQGAQPGTDYATTLEIIQLGGTGGLIIALIAAVVALWRERKELRDEIRGITVSNATELKLQQKEYTDQLKSQIEQLRQETKSQLEGKQDCP